MMNNMREVVKEGYEKGDYAGHFRASTEPNKMEKKFMDALMALIPETAKILDFGCGVGIPFDTYLDKKGFQITGIDISRKHIMESKKNVPDATFIEGDFSKTDFGCERFHAIIAMYSVFHIPREEQLDLFYKMHKLLENHGAVLMTLGASGGEGVEENWAGAPMAWSNFDPVMYKAMIAQVGFEITESEYEGELGDDEYHWWVLAKKNYLTN